MGADLVGYMVIGKKEITDEMKQAAIAKLGRLCGVAKALMLEVDEGTDIGDVELPKDVPDFWTEEFEVYGADFLEEFSELSDEDIVKRVEEAIDFLDDPAYRDCASRNISDDEFVLFCGEMTWGDEPEGGGYQLIKGIHKMGIEEELGLR